MSSSGRATACASGARLDGLKGRVTRSGTDVPVPADLETNIGEMINIVRHVADVAAAVGGGLRAGQFIICGSLTAADVFGAGRKRRRFRAGADRRGFNPICLKDVENAVPFWDRYAKNSLSNSNIYMVNERLIR